MLSAITIKGFTVTFSLILAIGAQNAFVLKQGLKKEFVFAIISLCIFIDVVLISSGVFGIGYIVQQNPFALKVIAIFGMLFLSWYGLSSLYAAVKGEHLTLDDKNNTKSLKEVLILVLVFSLLNPHTYLDTILLIGGIGASYIIFDDKILFLLGCFLASAAWFILLGYGSRILIPLFEKSITWRILDTLIAAMMFYIAFTLIELL